MRDNIDNQIIHVSELYLKFEKNLLDSLSRMNLPENHLNHIKTVIHEARAELNLLLTSSLTIDEHFLAAIIKLEAAYAHNYGE